MPVLPQIVALGLIPAHAGKTQRPPTRTRPHGAHPRSRGENVDQAVNPRADRGSSPLTRGKLAFMTAETMPWRLIPAHAGKTLPPCHPRCPLPAHPRSRGENYGISWRKRGEAGSSPLTRGKLQIVPEIRPMMRLIPAHAGKTLNHLQ